MKFILSAIECPSCKDILYSRAHHDMRFCSCHSCAIDGGLYIKDSTKNPQYSKLSGTSKPVDYEIEWDGTEDTLRKAIYDDWNYQKNKYGLVKK